MGEPTTLIFILALTILVIPWTLLISRIVGKAGFSKWWALVHLVPLVNIIFLWIFAFKDWPINYFANSNAHFVDKNSKGLTGWQRINIVITLIYCTFITLYGIKEYVDSPNLISEVTEVRNFTAYTETTAQERIDIKNNIYNNCLKDAENSPDNLNFCSLFDPLRNNTFIEPNFVKSPQYSFFILVSFILPLTFWLLAYFGFFVVRWIVRWVMEGFSKNA